MYNLVLLRWSLVLLTWVACGLPIYSYANTIDQYSTAFYYGEHPPLEQLKNYHRVIFDAGSKIDPKNFNSPDHRALAYVSVGEISSSEMETDAISKNWIIGQNPNWKSQVVDESNPDWQVYLMDKIIARLWNQGYTGFFLDTLDSYQLANLNSEQLAAQQKGLIDIINSIHQRYPQALIILNRGFELIPQLQFKVDGVAAESLFAGWNNKTQRYTTVSPTERNDLLNKLADVKKLMIPITIIDYLPPNNIIQAQLVADQIRKLGFWPWITNSNLTGIYFSSKHIFVDHSIPRKILIFYNGRVGNVDDEFNSMAVTFLAMPLNYLGYVPEYHNINEPLPKLVSKNEYAGIIMASIGVVLGKEQEIRSWELKQIHKKIPLVILNDFGFTLSTQSLWPFHLKYALFSHNGSNITILKESPLIGFEMQPSITPDNFVPMTIRNGKSLLTATNDLGATGDLAAITSWGGYAFQPLVLQETSEKNARWIINPFEFFKQALRLPEMPIPDTTTENGRRLMLAHVDGDSFPNKGQWFQGPFSGEIFKKEFFDYYKIPTTVSIIQGELASNGLFPQWTPDLEKIAREIFALPNVEIASHTYSHPFNWQNAENYRGPLPNPFGLPIPNYQFNIETEIAGSVNYINQKLAPPGKFCKVFLWSGEADVSENAVALTYQLGLNNMNGGDTKITKLKSSLTNVSGLGLQRGAYFEVFAPITNDFEITENMKKPRFSFIQVLDTFKMTDYPRRLKPIDIYNHFYFVDQPGGIKVLHQVYDWALSQPVMNLYVSEYSAKVLDFNTIKLYKYKKGWVVVNHGDLRELRVLKKLGYPDLVHSKNVIGFNELNDSYYIHLGPKNQSYVLLQKKPPSILYLESANARIDSFNRTSKGMIIAMEGYTPLKFSLRNSNQCSVLNGQKKLAPKMQKQGNSLYELPAGGKYEFKIQCS